MPNTFFGLMIGKSGLYAYQAAANTAAHNSSNVDTEGYSRQIVNRSATRALSVSSNFGMQGTGVNVDSITQQRSAYYDMKYRSNAALLGNFDTKSYYLDCLQSYISEVSSDGTTASMENIFTSLSSLEGSAGDLTIRTEIAVNAGTFTDYISSMYDRLSSIQEEANTEIKETAEEINSYAQQIAVLNRQINIIEVSGRNANDLRDARNLLLDKLSVLGNITTEETPMGDDIGANYFTVRLDGVTLVDSYNYSTLKVEATAPKVNQNTADGMYELTWEPSGQRFGCYSTTLGGKLQALYDLRDGNNNVAFTGKAEAAAAGTNTFVVKGSNINNMVNLNIPERDGTIEVGGSMYTYDYFEITVENDGSYSYTFHLNETLKRDPGGQDVNIGQAIDYKGVPYYMSKINEFVRTFSESFNNVHKSGYDLGGHQGLDFFAATDKVDGSEYTFASAAPGSTFSSNSSSLPKSYYSMTGGNFVVNEKILEDVFLIAASGEKDGGVDNDLNLKDLIALGSDREMFKEGTPGMFLQSLTSDIGVDAKAAINFAANQETVLATVSNQRLSISGVDSDEEAADLVRFKSAYDLSSKVISILNEMYSKLINETGV